LLLLLVGLAVFFAFFNAYRDSSSILAGVLASRAMQPRLALYLVGAAEFVAPFLVGSAVAKAVTTGLVDVHEITLSTLVIAMAAATLWGLLCWWLAIPSSSTHALVGGLVGAAWIMNGPEAVNVPGLVRVVVALLTTPVVGFGVGFLLMGVLVLLFSGATPRVNILFRRLQVGTAVLLAMSNSANDSQKSVGIITLGLVLAGRATSFEIPVWALTAVAVAMGLGASRGDWRQIRNLGGRVFRIRPLNALASQGASTAVVFTASALGMPVSTSHIISTSLMGSGAAERVNKVRWHIAAEMATAWILTIPATMGVAMLIFLAATRMQALGGEVAHLWGP
jgi:inorganic phosphate transporter, PiT family